MNIKLSSTVAERQEKSETGRGDAVGGPLDMKRRSVCFGN